MLGRDVSILCTPWTNDIQQFTCCLLKKEQQSSLHTESLCFDSGLPGRAPTYHVEFLQQLSLKPAQHHPWIFNMEPCCWAHAGVFATIWRAFRKAEMRVYCTKPLTSPQRARLLGQRSIFRVSPGNSACTICLCSRRAGTTLGLRMSWPDQLSTQQKCLLRIVNSFLTQGCLAWLTSWWSHWSFFSPQEFVRGLVNFHQPQRELYQSTLRDSSFWERPGSDRHREWKNKGKRMTGKWKQGWHF